MRIIFVRHGHPDYARDCLTELGHRHAAAAALRLRDEGIGRIFSSTCGRAYETAAHTAQLLGLTIEKCDFMREIRWGTVSGEQLPDGGSPWTAVSEMVSQGRSILEKDWRHAEPFVRNRLLSCVQEAASATDDWLRSLGYTREGLYYRAEAPQAGTVAAFGHGGASAAILSHIFNLPFPFVCSAMGPEFTGITIVELPNVPGELAAPRFELLNDARHIRTMEIRNVYGQ